MDWVRVWGEESDADEEKGIWKENTSEKLAKVKTESGSLDLAEQRPLLALTRVGGDESLIGEAWRADGRLSLWQPAGGFQRV